MLSENVVLMRPNRLPTKLSIIAAALLCYCGESVFKDRMLTAARGYTD